jgi:choline dehydrogenase-like flavoprotein
MLRDLRSLPKSEKLEFDLCVIGSGAAGLSIAREFLTTSLRVAVLEAGGLEYDQESQFLYSGEIIGLNYFPLDSCRLRMFGGTTEHWAGYCAIFKPEDFEPVPWVAHSGWPIGLHDLLTYYDRAVELSQLPPEGWNQEFWRKWHDTVPLPLRASEIGHDMFLIRPMRFGQEWRGLFERSDNIDVYLHAPVVEIMIDERSKRVTSVAIRTVNRNEYRLAARYFVLATGGIENARLLLASNSSLPAGLGNTNDLVGRFFTDHVGVQAGLFKPADPWLDLDQYRPNSVGSASTLFQLDMPIDVVMREQLVPASVRLIGVEHDKARSPGMRSMRSIRGALLRGEIPSDLGPHIANILSDLGNVASFASDVVRHGQIPIDRVECWVGLSPAPNPESRVTLSAERDDLGLPIAQLDWRLSPIDKRSARWMIEAFAAEAAAAGLGRTKILLTDDDGFQSENFRPAYHHIGTTRMADDPKQGVVDRHCRVHGIQNLFISGSSVFPTSGDGTPTLMLVALAVRLADHLKERLG